MQISSNRNRCQSPRVKQALNDIRRKPGVKGATCLGSHIAVYTETREQARALDPQIPDTIDGIDVYFQYDR